MRYCRYASLIAGWILLACPVARGDALNSQVVTIDGYRYFVVSNGQTTNILPLSIALGNEGAPTPGLSVLVQSGTTLNAVVPYSLTINLTWRFVLNREAVTKWVKANRPASPQMALLPSAHYVAYIAYASASGNAFEEKVVDQGNATTPSSYVASFTFDLESAKALADFLRKSRSVFLFVELQPEVLLSLEVGNGNIDDVVAAYFATSQVSANLPIAKIFGEALASKNPQYLLVAIEREISRRRIVFLGPDSDARYEASPSAGALVPLPPPPPQRLKYRDRVTSTASIDLCTNDESILFVDLGAKGCSQVSKLVERMRK